MIYSYSWAFLTIEQLKILRYFNSKFENELPLVVTYTTILWCTRWIGKFKVQCKVLMGDMLWNVNNAAVKLVLLSFRIIPNFKSMLHKFYQVNCFKLL